MSSDSLGFCTHVNPKNMFQGFTGCISYMTDQSAHLLFVKLCACRTYLFVIVTHPGISRVLGVWDCIATRLLFYRSQNNVSPALEILAASICLFPPFVASRLLYFFFIRRPFHGHQIRVFGEPALYFKNWFSHSSILRIEYYLTPLRMDANFTMFPSLSKPNPP